MSHPKRVFILGAGFSKPAGMPLATELLPRILKSPDFVASDGTPTEMQDWLKHLSERLDWLNRNDRECDPFNLNIEKVFHYAPFDIEAQRLKHHLEPVGQYNGSETPRDTAELIEWWLRLLENALIDLIFERETQADLRPIMRWAERVNDGDSVLTFNYDTLVEQGLSGVGKAWNHWIGRNGDSGIPAFKLHGSIDWIVVDRDREFSNGDLLFDNQNLSRKGHVEDDCRLWRYKEREELGDNLDNRDLQKIRKKTWSSTVGLAGLGTYKQLHKIPGLGLVWAWGMRSLYEADHVVIIGFSMSDFDTMAQMQFAEVSRAREREERPLKVTVVDPTVNAAMKDRFSRVFTKVDFVKDRHEEVDWALCD